MLKLLAAGAIAIPAVAAATVAATGVAWVDVKEGGRHGHRIVVPVPLLVAEAAASDDVFDRDSGLEFIDARMRDLAAWLSDDQSSRLRAAVRGTIEAW
jgi:hypothetical protein